jgi:hypothetical protein
MELNDNAYFLSSKGHRYHCRVLYGKVNIYRLTRVDTDEPTEEVRLNRKRFELALREGRLLFDGWADGKRIHCTSTYGEVKNVKRYLKK